jgi:putative oxidoreductase
MGMFRINTIIDKTSQFYERYTQVLRPLLLLAIRFQIGLVFWRSGVVKIEDFSGTVFLFQTEYGVPLLPPVVAAVMATTFELGCSVLLMAGCMARLAALPLLGMTAVIELTYDKGNPEHIVWALFLLCVVVFGAECLSVDGALLAHSRRQPLCIFRWIKS